MTCGRNHTFMNKTFGKRPRGPQISRGQPAPARSCCREEEEGQGRRKGERETRLTQGKQVRRTRIRRESPSLPASPPALWIHFPLLVPPADLKGKTNLYYLDPLELLDIFNLPFARKICVDECPSEPHTCEGDVFPCPDNLAYR